MSNMKGKSVFTYAQKIDLERLILLRNKSESSKQKSIRQKMRDIGLYGRDDFGITDMQLSDFHSLIKSGRIRIVEGDDEHFYIQQNIPQVFISKTTMVKSQKFKNGKDEFYVLDLCDKILGVKSSRQHKFDFLLGDKNSRGFAAKLPVDAYYEDLRLVVEYRERQHTEVVNIFDKPDRMTVSGVNRGEQRKIYDERRRGVLQKNGIKLLEISYFAFAFDRHKRIIPNPNLDIEIIKQKLILVNAYNL